MEGGAIIANRLQPQDSRLSLLTAQCLLPHNTALRLAMYTAAVCDCRWLRVLPAVRCLSQSTDFLFFVFLTVILVPKKKKRNENSDVFFGRKIKTPKNKKCVFWRRKIKRKRNSVGLYSASLDFVADLTCLFLCTQRWQKRNGEA